MASSGISMLPKLVGQDLPIWDVRRSICGGFLFKKAGDVSLFSRGKWQKRYFVIKTELSAHENYTLTYYYTPDESVPRQVYSLDSAILQEGGDDRNSLSASYDLICQDGSKLSICADGEDTLNAWLETLQWAIEIATNRGRIQQQRRGMKPLPESMNTHAPTFRSQQSLGPGDSSTIFNAAYPSAVDYAESQGQPNFAGYSSNAFQVRNRKSPLIRLDIDTHSMPPGSTERHQFEEMLINDIQRALNMGMDTIEVLSVRPAPGMNWLTLVELDARINHSDDTGGAISDSYDTEEGRRRQLLNSLLDMIKDSFSPLYSGYVTCKLDPTFNENFPGDDGPSTEPIFSTDSTILSILNKYKDVALPDDFIDVSHFVIYLSFEGQVRPMLVPNPLLLRRKFCNIWPFEIKQILGITDTMQELWIEPVSLIPKGIPSEISHAIFFEPSARLGGAVAINASRLKAYLTYEVNCEDLRGDVMNSLTDDERREIKETFDSYDADNNGTVSMNEMDQRIKSRTAERKEKIESKFQQFISEATSQEEVTRAEEQKRSYLQQLTESQNKMLKMFAMADLDGNGELSFTEFLLAEAWWIRCAINPDNAHLF